MKDSSSDSSAESKMSCIYLKQSSILKINDLQGREEKLLLCNAEKGPDDHSLGPFPDDVIISLNNKFLTMWKKKRKKEIKKEGDSVSMRSKSNWWQQGLRKIYGWVRFLPCVIRLSQV